MSLKTWMKCLLSLSLDNRLSAGVRSFLKNAAFIAVYEREDLTSSQSSGGVPKVLKMDARRARSLCAESVEYGVVKP
ncbi:hypothetical protein OGAPHI_001817 [Ogataea philodendri]|uniref:Uncharacterized protein n=1 Tax=Ogataea philodendri TaxID=1378263 RepID=A0A9P8P985_9ASCO|nr:uncharacterized protein OGAPHI_001817 [Ogataea philodendri]KAH3668063.1 hypothetical protein OGAPHI_001817 [Ogataea philodendri]